MAVIYSLVDKGYGTRRFQQALDNLSYGYFQRYKRVREDYVGQVKIFQEQLNKFATSSHEPTISANAAAEVSRDISITTLLNAWNLLALKTSDDLGKSAALKYV